MTQTIEPGETTSATCPAGAGGEVPPLTSPVSSYLGELHRRYRALDDGGVATYIPELAAADPARFGISLVTVGGAIYEVGDSRAPFTLQSVSKPLTYALVLDDHGEEAVRRRIGVEPTGEAFNSIALAPDTGVPFNAMVNAGAIAATSMVTALDGARPLDRLLATYSRCAGRPLSMDWATYQSESATGHRNRAIGHLLRNAGILDSDPEETLQLYFQQCSVLVDCIDLGTIAATLAAGGVNPLTGERVLSEDTVQKVLSVMTSCGMYDFAGEWLFAVGLPAKSGVSGAILAVLPGQLGVGVYSPRLDARGNSVRGVRVCEDISRDLDLHLVRPARRPGSVIRSSYDLRLAGSKRVRSEHVAAVLAASGGDAVAYELQGAITFTAAEEIVRRLVDDGAPSVAVLDLQRVEHVDPSVAPMFAELVSSFSRAGAQLVLSGADRHSVFCRLVAGGLESGGVELLTFSELDLGLEWCERVLLEASGAAPDPVEVALEEHELLAGLEDADIHCLRELMQRRTFAAGAHVLRRGDDGAELYLIVRGHLSVSLELSAGSRKRLATLSPGMVLGELGVVSREPRTADAHADTDVECYVLGADELDRLGETAPLVKCVLMENLVRIVARAARRMTEELARVAA